MSTVNAGLVACRSCDQAPLEMILSLGRTPLANSLLTAEELDRPEETYPLDLVFCPACSLVQIPQTVPPEKLFREYLYFSSFSDTMLKHAETLASSLTKSRCLNEESLVVEIASNDGYLLQYYKRMGAQVLGVEPAMNVARAARESGIPTLGEFFGSDSGGTAKGGWTASRHSARAQRVSSCCRFERLRGRSSTALKR